MPAKKKDIEKSTSHHWLAGTIERFEEKMAVILTKDGQKLLWPIKNLPDDCEVGTKIRLIISTSKTDQEERTALAKTILNEILQNKK